MTTHPDPRDDEIVSAVLDGEATEAERERVAADPALRARLDEFAAVRARVAAPVAALDELTARRLVTTAVESGPSGDAPAAGPSGAPPSHAHPWWRRSAGWVGSAAAVVAVVAGVSVLAGDLGSDDDSSAGDNAMVMSEDSGESDSPELAPLADDADWMAPEPLLRADSVDDLVALAVDRAMSSDTTSRAIDDVGESDVAACASDPDLVFADEPAATVDRVGVRGEVGDRSLVVWVVRSGDDVAQTVVIDATDCRRLDH